MCLNVTIGKGSDTPFGVSCLHNCLEFVGVYTRNTFPVVVSFDPQKSPIDESTPSKVGYQSGLHHGNRSLKVWPIPIMMMIK